MAEVRPLRALRYSLAAVGSLDAVASPPYDVIDDALRERLAARSPFNVVEVDLPRAPGGEDPYLHAQTTLEAWQQQGVLARDRDPALWAMTQEYSIPGSGERLTRHGFFCRVRVEDYGEGRIRPHERTHPAAREDRLSLQRATRANLSPIFSLYPDPDGEVWGRLEPETGSRPDSTHTDDAGTVNRLWRIASDQAIDAVTAAMADRELLIADGHHRYETARAYAREIGGEGEHSYVLMYLCSLSDPGLTVLPTHRLVSGLDDARRDALSAAVESHFRLEAIDGESALPPSGPEVAFGYLEPGRRSRITLADEEAVDRVLADKPEPYRRLDAAVLEALVLRGALGMSQDDIEHRHGLAYEQDERAAAAAVGSGAADAAFLLAAAPVEQVREVAAAGQPMPPKSTYFYPKIPTGLLFNPLE